MAEIKQLPIDYATKDFTGFIEMFKEAIPSLTPEWTDTSDSDMGMVILQLLSYGLHINSFNIDKGIQENLIQFAKTKRGLLLLSQFLGYEVASQKEAVSIAKFTKKDTYLDREVTIPEGFQISTEEELGDQVIFETDMPVTIPAGEMSATVSITEGETSSDFDLGIGNGAPNQSFVIEEIGVLDESIELRTIENGMTYTWIRVDTFISSEPQSRHFMTTLTEDDETEIIFGNGITGMIVPYGAEVTLDFRVGGGIRGNVSAGKITQLVDEIAGIEAVENTIEASGGIDFEDLERVRVLAPKAYRTGGSAVTPADFRDLAEMNPQISRAVVEETFNQNNDVNIYLSPVTGVTLTNNLMEEVKESIEEVMVMNANVKMFPVAYKDYDIALTVQLLPNVIRDNASFEIENLLRDSLDSTNFDFGEIVYLSRINFIPYQSGKVKNVIITAPKGDIVPSAKELPRLVNLSLTIEGGV